MAFLLGGHDAARASRYEHAHGAPSLRVALAFAAIFRREVVKANVQFDADNPNAREYVAYLITAPDSKSLP